MVLSHLRHDIQVSSKKNTGISEATGSEMSPITPPLVHFNRTSARVLISTQRKNIVGPILSRVDRRTSLRLCPKTGFRISPYTCCTFGS